MNNKELINKAIEAMTQSYSPYSNFMVGAALLTSSGKVYTGCNIENASFSPTNCAERTAFFKAISEGERGFSKIAVVGGINGNITDYTFPCGVCRQVMREFCNDDFFVIIAKTEDDYFEYKLSELLPHSFTSSDLGGEL
ncbi:MAG: cytidine deaminase [Ruminococcus sp.]|nr:cytidine deaminase [Ruminococcus sp.]